MREMFTVDLYQSIIYLATNKTDCNYLAKNNCFTKTNYENLAGICKNINNSTFLVAVLDGKISTLIHELSHVAIRMCEWRGINIEIDNSESFCYLLEYLTKQSLELIGNELK